MSTRRRYDTTALVGKMRQERRRNLLLVMCAAGTLGGLVVFYILNMRGMTIPEVPADATPRAPRGDAASPPVSGFGAPGPMATAQPATDAAPPAAPSTTPPPAPEPAAPTIIEERPPSMSVVGSAMPAAAILWIDDASVPRGTQLQLTAGRHGVRVKIGKVNIRERVEVIAGENIELHLDAKKKKLIVERHAIASKSHKE